MDRISEWWRGKFSARELRAYVAALTAVFWGLIGTCWVIFPDEHAFWILTHTFSYLGSFDADRNPEGWWLFTVAMVFWAVATVPLARHVERQLAPRAPRLARIGRRWLVAGAAGIGIVGLFPDAGVTFHGDFGLSDLHNLGAVLVALGFIVGPACFAAILLRADCGRPGAHPERCRCYQPARWPHGITLAITVVALYFLIRWEFIYRALKASAEADGVAVGTSWSEAMNTIYAFPLWDNVFVLTAFIYLAWSALALPPRMED